MKRTTQAFKNSSWETPLPGYTYEGKENKGTILFYHGQGECGPTDGSKLNLVERNPLPKALAVDGVRSGLELEYNVVAPQNSNTPGWWGAGLTGVKMANKLFPGDLHKIGLSLGSMCDIAILADLGPVFKSLCTCCGWLDLSNKKGMAELAKIPSIHFYDPGDTTIKAGGVVIGWPSVRDGVAWLKAQGADATLVELPGKGHNVWDYAYAQGHYLTWLRSKFSDVPVEPPVEPPVTRVPVKTFAENDKLILVYEDGTERTVSIDPI